MSQENVSPNQDYTSAGIQHEKVKKTISGGSMGASGDDNVAVEVEDKENQDNLFKEYYNNHGQASTVEGGEGGQAELSEK